MCVCGGGGGVGGGGGGEAAREWVHMHVIMYVQENNCTREISPGSA